MSLPKSTFMGNFIRNRTEMQENNGYFDVVYALVLKYYSDEPLQITHLKRLLGELYKDVIGRRLKN